MKKVQIEGFKVIGIAVRTTNENNQAKEDIGALWQKLMMENTISKIPHLIDETSYAIYTDYESDHTKPYTMILGAKVSSLDNIPDGMVSKEIEAATYTKFTAKGDLTGEAVVNEWMKIWNSDLDRTYTTDLEVYGEKAANPKDGEADIFIAVK